VSVPFYTRAHTLNKKKKKKKLHLLKSCCRNEEVTTYGIRVGSTRGLGFAMTFVDMIRFDYTIADRVDCVRAGNHG
jgi:hypothetical protein